MKEVEALIGEVNVMDFIINNTISLFVMCVIVILTFRVKKICMDKGYVVEAKSPFRNGYILEGNIFLTLVMGAFSVIYVFEYPGISVVLVVVAFGLFLKTRARVKRNRELNAADVILLVNKNKKKNKLVLIKKESEYKILKVNMRKLIFEGVDKNLKYEVRRKGKDEFEISLEFMGKKIKKYDFEQLKQ